MSRQAFRGAIDARNVAAVGDGVVSGTDTTPRASASRGSRGRVAGLEDESGAQQRREELEEALDDAIYDHDAAAVRDVLEKGATVRDYDLLNAVKEGNVPVMQLLLEKRKEPDVRDDDNLTLLYIASSKANSQMVELLLSRGADARFDNWSAVAIAFERLKGIDHGRFFGSAESYVDCLVLLLEALHENTVLRLSESRRERLLLAFRSIVESERIFDHDQANMSWACAKLCCEMLESEGQRSEIYIV